MIVIKPVKVEGAKFVSSTIAEPDPSQGEVEWEIIDDTLSTSVTSIINVSSNSYGNNLWALDSDKVSIHLLSIVDGTITTTVTATQDIVAIAVYNNTLYALAEAYSGLNSGFRMQRWNISDSSSLDDEYLDGNLNDPFNDICFDNQYLYATSRSTSLVRVNIITAANVSKWATVKFKQLSSVTSIAAISYDLENINILPISSGQSIKFSEFDLVDQGNLFSIAAAHVPSHGLAYAKKSNEEYGRYYSCDLSADLHLSSPIRTTGQRFISTSTHSIYEAVSNNYDNPDVGVLKTVPTWVKVQATNKFAEFDDVISTQSISQLTQEVEIKPAITIGGLAAINLSGVDTVDIVMTDTTFGVVYNETLTLTGKNEFAVLDLPDYPDATTKVTFTGTAQISVGALVLGPISILGVTNHGTSVQQLDFSIYKEDSFGNVQITKRPSAKLVNFKNTVQKEDLSYVYQQLTELTGVAAVWIGDETDENDFTLVYGSHRDNTLNIDSPTACSVPIQIRGRV